ncbi:MAG: chemotaxis-specific protein-glutamate methyltransferase CheB [Bryocella sp.]
MMQVGIVNDVRVIAESLRRIVADTPGFSVAWVAHDGDAAVERYRVQPVDIVLMDLVMPGMDGAQTTEAMMKIRSCAILVVTATVVGNRELVYAAMGKGALDAVNTPDAGSQASVAELRRKLTTVSRLVASDQNHPAAQPTGPFARQSPSMSAPRNADERTPALIGIGASTGGPQAIATILRGLPKDFNAAIVVVQHLDRQFVPGLERWLQRESKLPIRLAADDETLHRGGVWLADSDHHLIVRGSLNGSIRVQYTDEPKDSPNRPSVDIFFESMVQLRGVHRCGVLLTGMGSDGAAGLLALRNAGAPTFAQDAESCVVYGMPAVALKLGAIQHSTKLADMSLRLMEFAGHPVAGS